MRLPLRILFYAVNGLGLGHVTRLLAIARKVRDGLPDAEIVFFTSSEAEDVIYREGFAAFKVPSKTIRHESRLRATTYARMLQTITLNLVASFQPNLVVVDTFPAGALQELLPVLRWGSRNAFVFRAQRSEVAHSHLLQNALRLYDLVVVPHAEGEAEVPVPEGIESVWTGPILIRERDEQKSREEARSLLGLPPDGPVLYVTFGGGGEVEAAASVSACVAALAGRETPMGPLTLAVASAPLFRGTLRPSAHVVPVEYYPMAELYAAFDAAVSATGYNSAMELLHHGVPTAFMPYARQVDDQERRAAAIAGHGAGIELKSLDPEPLACEVDRLLDPAAAATMREAGLQLVPGGGATRAADALLRLVT